jgi:hypothetical protein
MNDSSKKRNLSAARVVASTMGFLVGLFGMEHGLFEMLQGSVRPSGLIIDAIGPAQEFWPGAMEPALTIIPNLLVSGLLATIVGLLVMIWSAAFIESRHGPLVLLVLCIILLLVGGGSPPLFSGTMAVLIATRINKRLTWWRTHLSDRWRGILAAWWPWTVILHVIVALVSVEIAIFGYPLAWFLSYDTMISLLYSMGYVALPIMVATILSAFAHDIQKQIELENEATGI